MKLEKIWRLNEDMSTVDDDSFLLQQQVRKLLIVAKAAKVFSQKIHSITTIDNEKPQEYFELLKAIYNLERE